MADDYIQNLIAQANKQYPFVKQHNPDVVLGTGERYAQTYPIGETGRPLAEGKFSRPSALPIDRVGIEIYKPNEFTHHDLAAELLRKPSKG